MREQPCHFFLLNGGHTRRKQSFSTDLVECYDDMIHRGTSIFVGSLLMGEARRLDTRGATKNTGVHTFVGRPFIVVFTFIRICEGRLLDIFFHPSALRLLFNLPWSWLVLSANGGGVESYSICRSGAAKIIQMISESRGLPNQ